MGETLLGSINKSILIELNSLLDFPIIEKMVLCFVDTPIFFLPIFLVSCWIYYSFSHKIEKKDFKKQQLLAIFYSCVIGITINLIIQQFVQLDRPESALEATGKLLLSHIPDASFPSDHAGVSISFLAALFFTGYRKTAWLFLPFVLLMNLSRVIVGVHWPFDIVGGAIVGIFSAFVAIKYFNQNKFVKRFNQFIINLLHSIKL